MPERKFEPYKDGELEIILSVVPTASNIRRLSNLLDRSEEAIKIVYKIAFDTGPFGRTARAQVQRIIEAKENVGIVIGRKTVR